jgi:DNA-binding transcriptional LysR family regulator
MTRVYRIDTYKYVDAFQKEITYFLTVAEVLNISKAAELLRIQQSGLSRAIHRLESDLGQKLFQRKNIGLILTPQGERFYKAVKDTKLKWEENFNHLLNDSEKPIGMIRLGLHSSFGQLFLPKIIRTLGEKFPQLELEIFDQASFQTTRKILDNEIDFGIVVSQIKSPELIQKNIGYDYLSAYHAQQCKKPTHLLINPDTQTSNTTLKKYSQLKSIQIKNYDLIAKAVSENNFAIALLPQSVASHYPNLLAISPYIAKVQISLICHKDKIKSVAMKSIFDSILDASKS